MGEAVESREVKVKPAGGKEFARKYLVKAKGQQSFQILCPGMI
jgi:hypothetical protein